MGQSGYQSKGLYNGYDKNHREREALDFYATPPLEVTNILDTIKLPLAEATILEPCVGEGHMLKGVIKYIEDNNEQPKKLYISDIKDRGCTIKKDYIEYAGMDLDFFADDYPIDNVDYVIMNPPYSVIEPFTIRALEIAQKGMLMLGRLQFLEGASRYAKILSENPPTDIWVYVDRIQCWKNGVKPTGSSAQCYAWFYWDKSKTDYEPVIHWIRRAG